MRIRRLDHRRGVGFTLAVMILKPVLVPFTVRDWRHGERIPAEGGCVVVLNHISHSDPLLSGHFIHDQGRLPHYLAKASLFRNPVLRFLLVRMGQIPVDRLTSRASSAHDAAIAAVRSGRCVVVYPEGTLTRDPDLWPMRGKTGAARIALATGCPVVPVGQWGAQDLLPPYARRPRLWPRPVITMNTGLPVGLDDLVALGPTPEAVEEATERIMDALTGLVAQVREGVPPDVRFDPRAEGVAEIGDPSRSAPPPGTMDPPRVTGTTPETTPGRPAVNPENHRPRGEEDR